LLSIALNACWHDGHSSSPFDGPPQLPQRVAEAWPTPVGVWPIACPPFAPLTCDAFNGCV
jgi:hypothetical protein